MSQAASILIVDDMADARNLLRLILRSKGGYKVLEARQGQEALDIAWQEGVDMVILDYMMPDLDGIEVCRRLRGNPRTANVPVLMLTARSGESTRREAFEAGVNAFMLKPLHPRELLEEVGRLLTVQA